MKRILEDINTGQFKHAYLLYGEESYLVRQYTGRLLDALSEPGDTVNTTFYEGKDTDPAQIIDLAETLPFFAKRRCIFIDESGFFVKKNGQMLAEYIRDIPESTYLVFSESDVDRRCSLFKQVNSLGRAVEFPRQKEEDLIKWILQRLKRENRQITRPVMELFLSRTGSDMERIDRELEKLLCYTLGRDVIRAEDVEAVCVAQLSDRIYDMVDLVADKQQKNALEIYYDLVMRKEAPMRILSVLMRQFRVLIQIKEMSGEGFDYRSMADQVKVPSFAVRKYVRQAEKFSGHQLREALRGALSAEEDIKTGRMNDRLAVELLLMTYSE